MKTIYNLEELQRVYFKELDYYYNTVVASALYTEEKGSVNKRKIDNLLATGNLFPTKEECQASIEYDMALAKIKREYSDNYSGCTITLFELMRVYDERKLEYNDTQFLISENFRNSILHIIEELPEECRTVQRVLKENGEIDED